MVHVHVAEIFIPSLSIATIISEDLTPDGTRNFMSISIYFKNTGCSSDSYLERTGTNRPNILYRAGSRYFYALPPRIRSNVTSSSQLVANWNCGTSSSVNQYFSPSTEVLEADIPFSLPIALPLRYEY
jgi:hypothetical protein